MREATVAEAAVELKVSVDTIKRHLVAGKLAGRKDEGGRWVVFLDNAAPAPGPESAIIDGTFGDLERLELRLAHAEELIAELRGRVAAQDAQIGAGLEERAELRRLLAAAMQMHALPAGSQIVHEGEHAARAATPAQSRADATQGRRWWQLWRPARESV